MNSQCPYALKVVRKDAIFVGETATNHDICSPLHIVAVFCQLIDRTVHNPSVVEESMQIWLEFVEFGGGTSNAGQVRKVHLEEDSFSAGGMMELGDSCLDPGPAARGNIHLGSLFEENLRDQIQSAHIIQSICESKSFTLAISLPTPELPPVTMVTRPKRSGTSDSVHLQGLPGKA
jgi:hypothetical protein